MDITASLLYDTRPRFPLPQDLVPAIQPAKRLEMLPSPLINLMKGQTTKDEHLINIASSIADLAGMAAVIEAGYATKGQALWSDEVYIGLRINPIAHRLLDKSGQKAAMGGSALLSEALRLAALIWIIWIKRRCRSYPGTPLSYVSKLLTLLSTDYAWRNASSASDLVSIRLWLLVLCGISSSGVTEERTIAANLIAGEMLQSKGDSWTEVMLRVRQMPWISDFEAPCTELEKIVRATNITSW